MPLVHDSQVVQKLGTLAAQRRLNRKYTISFIADPKILQLEVGDVFTIAHANHGGPVDVLITRMKISPMLDIQITGTVHTVALKNWSDLSPGAITVATDDSTNVYTPVYQGGIDAENPYTGENVITKTLLVGTGGTLETNIDPSTNGGLEITQTSLTGYNTSGDIRFQATYSGTDQGDVIIGNYSGNSGIKWDQSAGELEVRGSLKTTTGSVKRFEVSASDNEAHFYGDRGDTTIEDLATIGIDSDGGDYIIGRFGTTNSTRLALLGKSDTNIGVKGSSSSNVGVSGTSSTSIGVSGSSSSDYGVYGVSVGSSGVVGVSTDYEGTVGSSTNLYGVHGVSTNSYGGYFRGDSLGPICLYPSSSASAPSHSAAKGTLWVTSAGVLYINTSGSTTWAKVGAQ
jgi:hypothetical protein